MLNLKNLFSNRESEPYSKAFNRDSSPKVIIEGSVRLKSSWRFCLSLRKIWQRKTEVFNFFDFSTTAQLHIGLNFSCSLLSNFTRIWSCIENSNLFFYLKNFINVDLNCLIDLAPRMEFPKLLDSITQTGKKEYLKLSALWKNPLNTLNTCSSSLIIRSTIVYLKRLMRYSIERPCIK